jgi:hypothetical protein
MVVKKEMLEKLRGVLPAFSEVTFITQAHKTISEDEEMKDYIPTFKCRQFTNGELEKAKDFVRKARKDDEVVSKDEALAIVENCIIGWSNLFDISTGEQVEYSRDAVKNLPELIIRSILNDLWQYSGALL